MWTHANIRFHHTKTTLAHKPISEIISSCGHNPNWKRKRNSDSFSIYGFNVIPKSRNKKIRVYLHILSIWMRVSQHLTGVDITQAAQASICLLGSESISPVMQPNCKKEKAIYFDCFFMGICKVLNDTGDIYFFIKFFKKHPFAITHGKPMFILADQGYKSSKLLATTTTFLMGRLI